MLTVIMLSVLAPFGATTTFSITELRISVRKTTISITLRKMTIDTMKMLSIMTLGKRIQNSACCQVLLCWVYFMLIVTINPLYLLSFAWCGYFECIYEEHWSAVRVSVAALNVAAPFLSFHLPTKIGSTWNFPF
jgi:hypothetical protein